MGWTSGDFQGRLTPKSAIKFALGEEVVARVVDAALEDNVVYAAVRDPDGRCVRGLVLVLVRDQSCLHAKSISESMGPADDHCPRRILDLLTAPANLFAADWRRRCVSREAD
jgi:hypothetical protein